MQSEGDIPSYEPSIQMVKLFLQNCNYDIENKSDEEILRLYQEHNSREVMEFQKEVFDNGFIDMAKEMPELLEIANVIKEDIRKVGDDVSALYGIIDKYIEKYPYEELKFLIFSGIKKIPLLIVERVVKAKSYQYQEIWLEKIAKNLEVLPIEERSVLMAKYQSLCDNLTVLFGIYQQSFQKEEITRMQEVAQNKLMILKNFSPQLLEANYKAYYNESKEKLELVNEILKYTQTYPKVFLKNQSMERLNNLKKEIISRKEEEAQSKKLVFEHIRALEESMAETNDSNFDAACMSAINDLNNIELQKVVDYIGSKNKFFVNRFEEVAKRFRSKVNAKVF